MKLSFKNEFFFQLVALLAAFVIVHAIYIGIIRPNANVILEAQAAAQAAGEAYKVERSIWIVLKDYEQEACFILALWAVAIMAYKSKRLTSETNLLSQSFVDISAGTKVLPEDARSLSRNIESLPNEKAEFLLPRALKGALQRLESGAGVEIVSNAVKDICEGESQRLETELSLIRFITWAIPSVGFLGTVQGIGAALADAHEAIDGNIAGVTANLGVAFNSTFIALLLSILVMFLFHQLTLHQERLVLDSQKYCENNLIRHIRV